MALVPVITRPQRIAVVITSIVVGLTRFIPLSMAPWDWDEILFCLSLDDYNVALHQPHPAGFPLFILLGKIARLFIDSNFQALQAVNVAASLLVFPVMFRVARAFLHDFLHSWVAALLFSFLTNVWFYGGTAFSDTLGMVAFLGAIAAYLSLDRRPRRYVIASVWLAAGVLVRPQNAVVAVFPWTMATVRRLRARDYRTLIAGTLVLVALVGIGYGAAAYATGVEPYLASLRGHSQYVTRADSIANAERTPLSEVLLMQLDPFDAGKVMLAINLLALIGIVVGRRRVMAQVLLTFVPFFLFSALAANPAGTSRFSLNYLAGVVILAVEGTDVLARLAARITPSLRLAVHLVVAAVLLVRLITWGLPAFETPRTTIPPPTAAALWLRQYVPVTSTIFVHGSMPPWVKYIAPKHPRVIVSSANEVLAHPAAMNGWYIAMAPPPSEGAIGFIRPRNRTWNIVTKRGFEAFVQPTSEVAGFGIGWHNLEDDGTSTWRWSQRRAVIRLGPTNLRRELRLRFHVPVEVYDHPVQVTFKFNGAPLGSVVAKADNEVRYVVTGRADGVNVLEVETSDSFVPARKGGSQDQRELGIMLQSWSWRDAPALPARRKAA